MKSKSGQRTLFASVLLSAPGPLVVGLGLLLGKSSTQLADFVRRTAELAAIVISWLIFRITQKDGGENPAKKEKLEQFATYFVGWAMCVSGVGMMAIALLARNADKGNVVPGLVIAVLGVLTNTWFWLRYRKLHKATPNPILSVQSKLYRAKSFVDVCVTIALASILVFPNTKFSFYMDMAGSVAVALYLLGSGMVTLAEKR